MLDVRPPEEYAAGHIPGATSVPLAARLAELPPDAEVVAYCRGAYCVLAHDAVRPPTPTPTAAPSAGWSTGCWSGGWPGCRWKPGPHDHPHATTRHRWHR